ncbi:hypothetical protein TSOC_010681 [Tetrabaena socialis]|uniref:Uncharacterized protein n=1 Tax=Tetrabaena socialis TaxID=47790 RepID=A0A2J7ZSN4_9CHLO|nr:hypothetical protein TSOC_010681 [Tetrabaena socialis]|eukprot:PNH03276.1 hypothetical protein TSOC_010681 [Tetrabaena socialis]
MRSQRAFLLSLVPQGFCPLRSAALPSSAAGLRAVSSSQPSNAAGPELTSTSGRSADSDRVQWDWNWVLGKAPGRKPAIKRPARHQWLYCNPNYDPAAQLPKVLRAPYAPPSASATNDWQTYRHHLQQKPANREDEGRYRRSFVRFLKLRDLDWREAFQRGVAEDKHLQQKRERLQAEAKRQDAWRLYKEALFERARIGGGAPGGEAVAAETPEPQADSGAISASASGAVSASGPSSSGSSAAS